MKRFLIALICAVGIGVPATACRPPGPAPVIGEVILDCTLQNQGQIGSLIAEFATLLNGQTPDWAAIYQRAKQAGKAIGGCSLVTFVQDYLGNRTAPPAQSDSVTAGNALEKFRREEAGGATFRTSKGDL